MSAARDFVYHEKRANREETVPLLLQVEQPDPATVGALYAFDGIELRQVEASVSARALVGYVANRLRRSAQQLDGAGLHGYACAIEEVADWMEREPDPWTASQLAGARDQGPVTSHV